MPDRHHLDADPRSEYASNIEENDPGRDRLQLTRSGILCIERVDPDPNFTRVHEVGNAGVEGLLRPGEVHRGNGERNDEQQLFHDASRVSHVTHATPSYTIA